MRGVANLMLAIIKIMEDFKSTIWLFNSTYFAK